MLIELRKTFIPPLHCGAASASVNLALLPRLHEMNIELVTRGAGCGCLPQHKPFRLSSDDNLPCCWTDQKVLFKGRQCWGRKKKQIVFFSLLSNHKSQREKYK